jgi:hypothetical protein
MDKAKRLALVLAPTVVVLALLAAAGRQQPPKTETSIDPSLVSVQAMDWYKGGFDSIMMLSATVFNHNDAAVKDITLECDGLAPSGSRIDSNERTIYRIFPAGAPTTVTDFNMGFVASQVVSESCSVTAAAPAG